MSELIHHFRYLSDHIDRSAINKIVAVTWLNHHSLATSMRSECQLERFSLIGIDGFFLHSISRSSIPRSSADLFLPFYFSNRETNVGFIGGPLHGLSMREAEFLKRFPRTTSKFFIDGFSKVEIHDLIDKINDYRVNVLLVGMGTPFQENVINDILEKSDEIQQGLVIFTCGAWLEQLLYENYYPKWAYRYKLNWLVRLARDPKRLWKRYFIESFKVLFTKNSKVTFLASLPGYRLMQTLHLGDAKVAADATENK